MKNLTSEADFGGGALFATLILALYPLTEMIWPKTFISGTKNEHILVASGLNRWFPTL
jgi:hypothetical protein